MAHPVSSQSHVQVVHSRNSEEYVDATTLPVTMCGEPQESAPEGQAQIDGDEEFPWHLGVFDAHCHCAERPSCAVNLDSMKSRSLAIMATRTQDQSVVGDMAKSHGIKARDCLQQAKGTIVAGFGRHPWFSHELYDDTATEPTFQINAEFDLEEAKRRHYAAVLSPSPQDPAFCADLPTPLPLSGFLDETKERLCQFPLAMVGEIGIDSAFRLPMQWEADAKAKRDPNRTPGGRERRPLSPFKIQMNHQMAVLQAQLRLAGEMQRAVSVHGVQAHGLLFDALRASWKGYERKGKARQQRDEAGDSGITGLADPESRSNVKPFPPRICLHSFSGQGDAVRQYLSPKIPAAIFYSFSATNNMRNGTQRAKMESALQIIPDNRLLVESDLHEAGDRIDHGMEEAYRFICKVKNWTLEEGVQRIAANFEEFVFG